MTRASCPLDGQPAARPAPAARFRPALVLIITIFIFIATLTAWLPIQRALAASEQPLGTPVSGFATQTSISTNGASVVAAADHQQETARSKFRLVRAIFDFNNYKQLFHKSYHSLVEELVRRKYFLSRALRAFVSALKYKYHRLTYYLAINHLSDLTPQELDQMDNRHVGEPGDVFEEQGQQMDITHINSAPPQPVGELPEFNQPESLDQVEAEIEQLIENQPMVQSMDRELLQNIVKRRLKRDVSAAASAASDGAIQQIITNGHVSGPFSEMKFLVQDKGTKAKKLGVITRDLSDELFVDHRKSGCLMEPRGQGKCGCCYSFTMVAYMEWLYCMKTKKRVSFSEQYLIDCGKSRVGNLDGCSGGGRFSIGDFVANFGLELRSNYPYRMREDTCPYANETRLAETGAVRWTNFNLGSSVPIELWHIYLKYGPMTVSLSTRNTGFKEYGGGVYDGANCDPEKSNHMMLLVGHGREDNQEYWLIRNSYTVGWGEQGYYKLSKGANCIYAGKGFMYGTSDGGRTFAAEPIKNRANNRDFVKEHYARNMAQDLEKFMV